MQIESEAGTLNSMYYKTGCRCLLGTVNSADNEAEISFSELYSHACLCNTSTKTHKKYVLIVMI